MATITQLLIQLTSLMQPYLSEIALTLIATILVVYGDLLNKQIKRALAPYHFVLRTLVFVLICAFGYSLLIVHSTPLLKQLLLLLDPSYRGIVIVASFLMLGYLAERRRYI